MSSYAVKHVVAKTSDLLSLNLSEISTAPCSYTSKKTEANRAADGNYVYVIEVHTERKPYKKIYRLAYKYRAFEVIELDKGALWKNKYRFKNTVKLDRIAEGTYFEEPVEIKDLSFYVWYLKKCQGMCKIDPLFVPILDALFDTPSNNARVFKYPSIT